MLNGETGLEGHKRAAAERALELVRPGMVVGLGTGTTARYFIEGLGKLVGRGLQVKAVVTSSDSRRRAEACGIPLAERLRGLLDLTVDGADEISPSLDCIKGRGGALLREKIVAHASRRFVLIADHSKVVDHLGRGPVPVEVLPFLWERTAEAIAALPGSPELRLAPDGPFRTDNGNLVLDVRFSAVDQALGSRLHEIPGVIEHGLFFRLAQAAIVAGPSGTRVLGELG
ncbi:MAG TPA: ribose-5-phosphate isomerase RpiA [Candidatus Dormibacteraeota bacterium]|jgi:ribose 5-phosphate isomerase A